MQTGLAMANPADHINLGGFSVPNGGPFTANRLIIDGADVGAASVPLALVEIEVRVERDACGAPERARRKHDRAITDRLNRAGPGKEERPYCRRNTPVRGNIKIKGVLQGARHDSIVISRKGIACPIGVVVPRHVGDDVPGQGRIHGTGAIDFSFDVNHESSPIGPRWEIG